MAAATLGGSKKGSDSKYFATTSKGEILEWKNDLNSLDKNKVKEAVKRVIAAMTVGKDVSSLFTDVIKGITTDNLELKKLVYLYIINYARSQPDKAILVVNSFRRDATEDKNALVRALAIRTMGCIRVDKITTHLAGPLSIGLKDKDAYVRKTAAICVAKLYDIDKDLVEEEGFLETLRELIGDPNPTVVANAVAALAEIAETATKDVFQINQSMIAKLSVALGECTEWGRTVILDCLAKYEPDAKEAEDIIERASPHLMHANSAVVMSAVKVILKFMEKLEKQELKDSLITSRLPPCLRTLLSDPHPEIQYAALRNINLIVQKYPLIMADSIKYLFCQYHDPLYVKMEKLDIMVKIANQRNVDKVLLELKEYATEVDVEFVRKAVHAIGRCAVKLEKAAEKCVKVLLELIQTQVSHVMQEVVIVLKDIFRKYPNRYEAIIPVLCENLESLNEPDAKASMVWIIGEYASRIENANQLLEFFTNSFYDETPVVQLQLLTAVVKLFLVKPQQNKLFVEKVLDMATQQSDNPDLRDRGYIYWRLLSTDPEAARKVVCGDKPSVSDDSDQLDISILNVLISNISTLASIYHKPPEYFLKDGKSIVLKKASRAEEEEEEEEEHHHVTPKEAAPEEDEEDERERGKEEEVESPSDEQVAKAPKPAGEFDLLGLSSELGLGSVLEGIPPPLPPKPVGAVAPSVEEKGPAMLGSGQGITVRGSYARQRNVPVMLLIITNDSQQTLSSFKFKFRANPLGITVAPNIPLGSLAPGAQGKVAVTLETKDSEIDAGAAQVQMAIKTEIGVLYFKDNVPADIFIGDDGEIASKQFLASWKELGDGLEVTKPAHTSLDATAIKDRLRSVRFFQVASRDVPKVGKAMYFSIKFRNETFLIEVTLKDAGSPNLKICVRSAKRHLSEIISNHVVSTLEK